MSEPKPLASLSSGLLARKGQASPAMRRQSMMLATVEHNPDAPHNPLEDLGWNDMGGEGDEPQPSRSAKGLSPMPSLAPVVADVQPVTAPQPISPDITVEVSDVPEVVRQQENLAREVTPVAAVAEHVEAPAPVVPAVVVPPVTPLPRVRAAAGARAKAAFTLRLDAERHLKLRLVCAVTHRSAQQVVTEALDAFLAQQPTIADMVGGHSDNQ
jgi:hypothetical protein